MSTVSSMLVVDDDVVGLYTTVELLRGAGYEVTGVETGADCLRVVAETKPDLVICDVLLPDIEGHEVCRRIRATPELQGTHVVLMSGARMSSDDQTDGLDGGADAYILRPLPHREFLARVRAALRLQSAEKMLLAQQTQLRNLAANLAVAEQVERQRIATGLHDDICQMLVVARIKHEQTGAASSAAERETRRQELAGILEDVIETARDLVYELSNPILSELGFAAAVEWEAKRVAEASGLPVRVEASRAGALADGVATVMFQAVRELLSNAARHAGATQLTVRMARARGELRVSVEDDGVGFDPSPAAPGEGGGFGLAGVRERLGYVGGRLQIDSAPARGARCEIVLPLDRPDEGP
jgi:signal transduction histidine kinase